MENDSARPGHSLEGAGGIGGLLAMAQISNAQISTTASYFYDGNGNVTDLVNADGTSAAHYTYGPFGERLSATGALADANPYQFSSKERDSFTGFYYYGLRYYDPTEGRWLSRDPLEERGGVNLFAFCANDSIDNIDSLGLTNCKECEELARQKALAERVRNCIRNDFRSGGYFAQQGLDSSGIDFATDATAISGFGATGYSLNVDSRLVLKGKELPYGMTYFNNITPEFAARVRNVGVGLGAIGLGADIYSTATAYGEGNSVEGNLGVANIATDVGAFAVGGPPGWIIGGVQAGTSIGLHGALKDEFEDLI
jgi:RHS repeat-associated protein